MKYYDISVIIPVYNCEKFIKTAIKSLINQTYDFRKIEVLLINDGSTDNSLEICKSYERKYSNIKVFSHENRGVSYTRNVGLMNATGAYITFLDSDDYLSSNAIKGLITFFDEHSEEIDMVTYPIYNVRNGKETPHVKNNIYKISGVYDANEITHFPTTTINVVIKNRKKKNILFNENLKAHEDCNHNIKHVMSKQKYGYCKEAIYYYVKHDGSAVSSIMNPYYIFEDWMNLCEEYIEKYTKDGLLNRYIQQILLYEISWKLTSNNLYPRHLSDKKTEQAKKRVAKLISKIEDEVILSSPHLDKFHKFYLISLKQNEIEVKADKTVQLISNGKTILNEKDFEIVITRFKVINEKIHMMGFFKSCLYNFYTPNFYIIEDGVRSKLETKISTHSCYKTKIQTNNFYMFDLTYDMDNINSITFEVEVENKFYPVRYYLMPTLPFNKALNRLELLYGNNKISLKGSTFEINKITTTAIEEFNNKQIEKYNKINKNINYYRKLSKISKDEIWLYNDRDGLVDNAYYQFIHDIEKKDGIKRYYVVCDGKDFINKNFTRKQRKHLVKFKSLKHKILFLNANKVITSFKDLEMFSPFSNNALDWYRDVLKYELVYLQHGILHCHTPWLYSKEASHIDKIVLSSKYEYENMINNYSFNPKDFIMSGMPRLDIASSSKKENKQKRILIALSWRVNLMGGFKDKKYIPNESKYLKSEYYKEVNALLTSKKFTDLLEKNNIICEFMPHPIFRVYTDLFKIDNPNIKFVDSAVPSDYDLIITDYSSIVFDYVYAGVPVMYFVPDYDLYKAGITHIFNKLDLPMEEGFGPFTKSVSGFIKEFENFIKNNYKLDKKYEEKSANFFISKSNHRENLYQELMDK